MNTEKQPMPDAHERACDSCPFLKECEAYKEAFGSEECERDDFGKALMDYLKHTEQRGKDGQNN